MPLSKLQLKPGVNRENTRYTNEGKWYESNKIRFRQGTPEKIGGWSRISTSTFLGLCRSLFNWVTLGAIKLVGVGTNTKFYLESGGIYNDITPFRSQVTLTNPFGTTSGSSTVTVTDANGGYSTGAYVTFYGATSVGGLVIFGTYVVTTGSTSNVYTIDAGSTASSTATGGGTVYALYQINPGPAYVNPIVGWGAGMWSSGTWGTSSSSLDPIRLWSQSNFGEDLIFGPRGGAIYYWDASIGYLALTFYASLASPTVISTSASFIDGTPLRFAPDAGATLPSGIEPGKTYFVRNSAGITFNISATYSGALINVSGAGTGTSRILPNAYKLSDYGGGTDVPIVQNFLLVSDISRFVFAFGANEYAGSTQDPMMIRWSDQDDATNWTPSSTNQAGFLRLSRGSELVTAIQGYQSVYVFTDTALYSLQYVGAPIVWSAQIIASDISIVSQNAVVYVNNIVYWMGKDKFYYFDGTVHTLNCDLLKHTFSDFNTDQFGQVFAGTLERYNEVWWFYCSAGSTTIDRYVVFNYAETLWYYGTMARTAWIDTSLFNAPMAATYSNNLVLHETGTDDDETGKIGRAHV